MSKKLSIKQAKQKLYEIHGDNVLLDVSTYLNTRTKAKFIDKDYGEWWSTPNNIFSRGSSHPAREQEKIKKTCLKKYGFANPLQNKEMIKKRSENRKLTIEQIKNNLKNLYGDLITIKEETYKGSQQHAIFIDKEFGSWSARVTNVLCIGRMHPKRGKINQVKKFLQLDKKLIKQKVKETTLKKYGVEHYSQTQEYKDRYLRTVNQKYGVNNVQQDKDISLKSAKSSNHTYILYHWKTNEELVCRGSYEKKVVEYLNKNKINFLWQPQVFKTPFNSTYRPDLYLADENKWVEIKGFFRKDAQEKWDWFISHYSNSELWDKKKLENLNIL